MFRKMWACASGMAQEQGNTEPALNGSRQSQGRIGFVCSRPALPSNPRTLVPLDWRPKEGLSNSNPGLSTSFLPATFHSLSEPSPHWEESLGWLSLSVSRPCRAPCYLLAGARSPSSAGSGTSPSLSSLAHSRANVGFWELGRARSSILKWTNIPTAPTSLLTNRATEIRASRGMREGQTATLVLGSAEYPGPLEKDIWPGMRQVPLAVPSGPAKARSEGSDRMKGSHRSIPTGLQPDSDGQRCQHPAATHSPTPSPEIQGATESLGSCRSEQLLPGHLQCLLL